MQIYNLKQTVDIGAVTEGDLMQFGKDFYICTGLGNKFDNGKEQYAYQVRASCLIDRGAASAGESVEIDGVFYNVLAVRDCWFGKVKVSGSNEASEVALALTEGLSNGAKKVTLYGLVGGLRNYLNGEESEIVLRRHFGV